MHLNSFPRKFNQLRLVSFSRYMLDLSGLIHIGLVFVIAQAGGAIFPSLIGLIAAHAGVKVLQPIIAGLIVLMGITWVFVPKPTTHRE